MSLCCKIEVIMKTIDIGVCDKRAIILLYYSIMNKNL